MLDSLGSTLSSKTINSFTRNGKKPMDEELSQAIQCLETELNRPKSERRKIDLGEDVDEESGRSRLLALLLYAYIVLQVCLC
jgi:phosphatidylserine decarboxylase